MYSYEKTRSVAILCAAAGLIWICSQSLCLAASVEQHFDTLTIGTQTYSNVTVTTRSKSYVFLLHSAGMMNVKVADLSEGEKQELGYEPKKPATNAAVAWAKTTIQKIESPQIKKLETRLKAPPPPEITRMINRVMDIRVLVGVAALLFGFYLFMCYCSKLICTKAGSEPGVLIWIPILQTFPLLRAAGMSGWWFFAALLPVLNIVTHLVWCFKIARARGKGLLTAIFLILPFTNFFAYLYLAFSNGEQREEPQERIQLMRLEPA